MVFVYVCFLFNFIFLFFFFLWSVDPRVLHSFPTRRSSDLAGLAALVGPADRAARVGDRVAGPGPATRSPTRARSEEHTSELQSQSNLVCRLLLEKKKKKTKEYNKKQ